MENLISVIVPVYNAEKYLYKCVQSILNQTYDKIEIILVDDGSTDNSGKICDEISMRDTRIRVLHKKNGGQSSARNAGIKIANGEYITFVDNDDWLEPNMYEILIENANKYNADISGCATMMDYEDGKSVCRFDGIESKVVSGESVCLDILYQTKYSWGTMWNKIFKKELFNVRQFPEGCELEDYYIILQLFNEVSCIYFDNRPLYHWIQRSSSQSKRGFHWRKLTGISIATQIKEYFQTNNYNRLIIKACNYFVFLVYSDIVWSLYKSRPNGWKKEMHRLFKPSIKTIFTVFWCRNNNKVKINRMIKMCIAFLFCIG